MMYEYKTIIYKEGLFRSVIFGASKVNPNMVNELLKAKLS